MRPSTRLSRCRLLLPALLPLLCSAAQLPPGARSRSGALDSSRDKADEQQKLLQRVVDARLSAAEHLLPSEDDNTTHPMLKAPLAAFSKTTAWLRRENPTLFAFLLGALATTSKEQNDLADGSRTQVNKGGHCRLARRSRPLNAPLGPSCQVELEQDYHVAIVTTAALPWMTGTAVNPLLRAAHLAKAGKRVTLVVPWLHPLEQGIVFPHGLRFDSPAEQEEHIRAWLRARAGLRRISFEITFYAGRYDADRGSILPIGDITRFIESSHCDVCVLEEPEHLTWYHNGASWRHRFKLVVGVIHTNYIFYARTWASGGPILAATLESVNQFVCGAYCDKVIKLSDTLQPLPRAIVCNVHGVRKDFVDIGRRKPRRFRKGAYFLGKVLWAKGHRLLLDYLQRQVERGETPTHIDVYGKGEDLDEVRSEAEAKELDVTFHGPTDHAGRELREYKVFVNPSLSEVLSTTTAEALAMGKFVVIQRHPSNDFFLQFRNALPFETANEFLLQLRYALAATPTPLSKDERRRLSWEGATERFLTALTNSTRGTSALPSLSDHTAQWVHQGMQRAASWAT